MALQHFLGVVESAVSPSTWLPSSARHLALTPYDLTTRFRGAPPWLLAGYVDRAEGEELEALLTSHGVKLTWLTQDHVRAVGGAPSAIRVALESAALVHGGRTANTTLPVAELSALIRMRKAADSARSETPKRLGEAVLTRGTGGALGVGVSVVTTATLSPELVLEEGEDRLFARTKDGRWFQFNQSDLHDYSALGPVAPTRHANFLRLTQAIHARFPAVSWDERLLQRSGLVQIVNRFIALPEAVPLAVLLVARAVGQ